MNAPRWMTLASNGGKASGQRDEEQTRPRKNSNYVLVDQNRNSYRTAKDHGIENSELIEG